MTDFEPASFLSRQYQRRGHADPAARLERPEKEAFYSGMTSFCPALMALALLTAGLAFRILAMPAWLGLP
jgi:hypothetical protein